MFSQMLYDAYLPQLNLPLRERWDPLLFFLFAPETASQFPNYHFASQVLIFFLGSMCLMRSMRCNWTQSILGSLALLLSMFVLSNGNLFFCRFSWFPALLAATWNLDRARSKFYFVASLGAALLWTLSAGFVSVLGALFAFAAYVFEHKVRQGEESPVVFNNYRPTVFFFVLFLMALVFLPVYQMPNYPPGAQLVPISYLSFQGAPLIGPALQPNPLHATALEEASWIYVMRYSLIISVLLLIFLGRVKLRQSEELRLAQAPFVLLFSLLVVVLVELLVPEGGRMLTPFQLLRRFVPGVALSSLPWILLPFALLLAFPGLSRLLSMKALSVLCLLLGLLGISARYNLLLPTITDEYIFGPLAPKVKGSSKQLPELMNSPSGYVIRSYGDWTVNPEALKLRRPENLRTLNAEAGSFCEVSARPHPENAPRAVDGKKETSWHTARAQRPGDYFEVELCAPQEISRITLSVGRRFSDFPRGIQILASADGENFDSLFTQENWLGPLKWTEEGYPYLGPQSDVTLDFEQAKQIKKLRFVQIGHEPNFDWSIAEISLYSATN